jgi:hypothetical protein
MPVPSAAGRLLVLVAVALLAVEGVALLGLGLWTTRPGLALGGGALLAGARLVWWSWQRQRRRLEEIAAVRRELRADAEELRRATRR